MTLFRPCTFPLLCCKRCSWCRCCGLPRCRQHRRPQHGQQQRPWGHHCCGQLLAKITRTDATTRRWHPPRGWIEPVGSSSWSVPSYLRRQCQCIRRSGQRSPVLCKWELEPVGGDWQSCGECGCVLVGHDTDACLSVMDRASAALQSVNCKNRVYTLSHAHCFISAGSHCNASSGCPHTLLSWLPAAACTTRQP